ncbi:MAG TPA: hypothetical protein VD993_13285 [Chitinophagaceae bacterium]|nr:hypothetical protein [Chitinophagaceae bacterium]
MKTVLFFVVTMVSLNLDNNKLVGRWESMSVTGNVTGVVFKEDNTFEGYVNKKPFVSGTYTFHDGIFTMQDNGCMDAVGTYKITFFSNDDSMRIELLSDDCTPRGNGTNNRVFGRVKKIVL